MNPEGLPNWVSLSSSPQPSNRVAKRYKGDDTNGVDLLMLQNLSLGPSSRSSTVVFPSFLFTMNQDAHTSLIRILSVGNERELNAQQLEWMHQQVQHILLTANNNCIHKTSRLNCTALHLAIRHYGSYQPLFMTLLNADQKLGYPMLSKRDDTGEFAIHTACRMGIPTDNLRLLLRHMATPRAHIVCSPNNRGWTPFDLAWMRHMESSSHEIVSTLQSLDGSCREAERRISTLFATLLSEMVEHVLQSETSTGGAVSPLLDVLSVLIGACVGNTGDSNDANQYLVHRTFQILPYSEDSSPLLPLPLIQLMLHMYPHQVSLADHNGKLPLHYALSMKTSKAQPQEYTKGIPKAEWRCYIQEILNKSPSACLVKDSVGRLPIHYSLETNGSETRMEGYDLIVRDVVLECPAAVEIEDPVTSLYPFMMAAANSNISLDTVYRMLRFHPQCLPSSVDNARYT